ncbi:hypothetical protein D8674_017649 [Pyrus ussuriensis x Pyrus communis]|uniref:Uncharacterized protein n=1 Tax=Pyrus ussuriensis x Pyrus communis TaxID=2448454 RepID=A0A5N5HDB4_9ROSA|nr:hypothetical protein D8674_017649 [Pyrus ussuriensis x Pyrus communis]
MHRHAITTRGKSPEVTPEFFLVQIGYPEFLNPSPSRPQTFWACCLLLLLQPISNKPIGLLLDPDQRNTSASWFLVFLYIRVALDPSLCADVSEPFTGLYFLGLRLQPIKFVMLGKPAF